MKKYFVLVSIIFIVFLTACSTSGPDIQISDAWVRPDPLWENAAGYFVVSNDGGQSDFLIGVSADFTNAESLHQTVIEGDIHKMLPVDRLEIPPGEQISFQPMSYHIMMMDMQPDMEYGQTVTLVFEFEKSGLVSVDAELRSK